MLSILIFLSDSILMPRVAVHLNYQVNYVIINKYIIHVNIFKILVMTSTSFKIKGQHSITLLVYPQQVIPRPTYIDH